MDTQPPRSASRHDGEDAQTAIPKKATTKGSGRPNEEEEEEDVKNNIDENDNEDADDDAARGDDDDDDVVFLLLGEGDFTFSLDLATWAGGTDSHYHLICTSFDTLDELQGKYKDTDSILHRLQSQQQQHQQVGTRNDKRLSITVRHGVNAIVNPSNTDDFSQQFVPTAVVSTSKQHDDDDDASLLRQKADHVCFHHPHLGTENAALHRRFLAHLFHSIDRYWMRNEVTLSTRRAPVFHLTLVDGQFERWKAEEAAQRHRFVLLDKKVFVPPPVAESTYCYRRHQTGKSFGNRRRQSTARVESGGSTTYTFGRLLEKGHYIASCLPWQTTSTTSTTTSTSSVSSIKQQHAQQHMLSCPFCDKKFVEKRSLKSHVKDKHQANHGQTPNQNTTKRLKLENGCIDKEQLVATECSSVAIEQGSSIFRCSFCEREEGRETREFSSQQGLDDHIRAKHSGIHTYIAPDWSQASRLKQDEVQHQHQHQQQQQHHGSSDNGPTAIVKSNGEQDGPADTSLSYHVSIECNICGSKLAPGNTLEDHMNDFLPTEGGSNSPQFACRWCTKIFREERAVKQHENFCSFSPS